MSIRLPYERDGHTRPAQQKNETRRNFSGFLGRGEKIRTSDPLTPSQGESSQPNATARNDTHGDHHVQCDAAGCRGALPFPAAFSGVGEMMPMPVADATAMDMVRAVDAAIVHGDLHAARRLLRALRTTLVLAASEGATAENA